MIFPPSFSNKFQMEYPLNWAFGLPVKYKPGMIEQGEFENEQLHGKGIRKITGDSGQTEEGKFIQGFLHGEGRILFKWNDIEEMKGQFESGKLNGIGLILYRRGKIEKIEGIFRDNILNGYGRHIYRKEEGLIKEYIGEFVNGKLHGLGRIIYTGRVYQAGYFKAGKLDGFGFTCFGCKIGFFTAGILNGRGAMEKNSRIVSSRGNYINDKLHGFGKMKIGWGSAKYHGEFDHGKFAGIGVKTYYGSLELGQFWKDNLHGLGCKFDVYGDQKMGDFQNGVLQGQGRKVKIYRDSKIIWDFRGEFKEDQLHGRGVKIHYDPKIVYEGDFEYDELNGIGRVLYEDGSREEGEFVNDWLHGQGIKTTKEGIKFQGGFKEGNFHGIIKQIFPDGKVSFLRYIDGALLEGNFEEGGEINGKGKVTFVNGDVWEGEIRSGLLQGQGKKTTLNGVAEGEFFNGQLNGIGKHEQFGLKLEGEFRQGRLNGMGREECFGLIFEGHFEDGTPKGYGKETSPSGYVLEGDFLNRYEVVGKMTCSNGEIREGTFYCGKLKGLGRQSLQQYNEEGNFKSGKLHGKGKRISPLGEIHEGEFVEGQLHGLGKIYSRNHPGSTEGNYVNGKLEGYGKIDHGLGNGDGEEGQFKAGQLHGKGKRIIEGQVEEGLFEEGRLITPATHQVEIEDGKAAETSKNDVEESNFSTSIFRFYLPYF